ncbi:glycoside hydrolase family 7 protein [Aspergillus clavatus NRRL 1]|uniref:Probable endo-beta-1,4-glucanase celB n=1 Tax=Aspergillus clavatus (strain ATCC 1007 / CBS 513.65 / DSM 816 / NCTC 3887 / NRRL 1 / QM 1276 / 107) TaxID=344612 RepID=CELB_ASPCL|nr:endo-1,4-beta-glucanase [Aspergillus clavatus NRRL 1]A1CG87.1 RecName: Full=Probable endo-beta-1,4-glucanase celB; Short=Endoglucanase celB; AltName: Full=Carboxymethylcellulase celB; AltName: Full=Cellulase B; Flags: Precursor [Aspergillus clavatus NRRL 1]EAW10967.1 endo-1,4-beta-glucanase [Aspergillus clavatus NRRL 1]
MVRTFAVTALALLPLVAAQQIGSTKEVHPQLTTYKCTSQGGCVKQNTSIVLDSGSHWIHAKGGEVSCTTSSGLDPALCPDKETCAENCVVEGITDYSQYGVQTRGDAMLLREYIKQNNQTKAPSPRVYLLDEDGENYSMLRLLNQEFTFDVDVSKLPCGMNGALYFSEMSASGGRSALNPAGAAYGTGYCDAQCYTNAWINGEANTAKAGLCCQEMDIWEANARANAFTPHPCNSTGLLGCAGDECNSVCDKAGCGFNPYALGARDYYGTAMTVDTTKPFTVVTQFLTADNSTTGALREIRRLYVQAGQVIQNAVVKVDGRTVNSITEPYCASQGVFEGLGGLRRMGEALGRGMVLSMSIWNDAGGFMHWLDSGNSGPCSSTEGDPSLIENKYPDTAVTFSKIRWGDLGTTFATRRLH